MCGLSGAAGEISLKDEKYFREHLIFNTVRGDDSTGIAVVPTNDKAEVKVFKGIGPAYDLIMDRRYDRCFHGMHKALIGHNRSATRGGISHRAAHPFVFQDIVGCHNGTLDESDWHRLDIKKDCVSDSEAILFNIQTKGVDATFEMIGNGMNEQNGCVVWFDQRDSTINFVKNDKRTLYYIYAASMKTVYWGSEPELLLGALRRNEIKIEEKCHQMNHDKWIRWKIPFSGVLTDPIVTDIKYHKKKIWGGSQTSGTPNFMHASTTRPGNSYPPQAGQSIMTPGTAVVPWAEANKVKRTTNTPGAVVLDSKSPFFGCVPYFDDERHKIMWSPSQKIWIEGWMPRGQTHWVLSRGKIAPISLGYSTLDINSRHEFKHQGKKKRKKIFYRGYGGTLLERESFEDYMKMGCQNCSKAPEWGNKVEFVSHNHDFLCEFCSLDTDLLSTWKEVAKLEKTNAA